MAKGGGGFTGISPVDPSVGKPTWEAARDAHARGATLWTCTVVVAGYVGAAVKVSHGATSTTRVSPDELLIAIEQLGWRLEHVSHAYVQTTTSTNAGFAGMSISGVSGQLEAHYTFRRA